MAAKKHIADRRLLSQYPQLSTLVFHLLNVSAAGNKMTAKECERLYNRIMSGFEELNGRTFWPFRDELMKILVTPDAELLKAGQRPFEGYFPHEGN